MQLRCKFAKSKYNSMQAGVAKAKVQFRKNQMHLFGYGRLTHKAEGAETDLFARAFVFKQDNKHIAFLILETYLVSHHLKVEILSRLAKLNPQSGIFLDNLMLCGQNTHSAPGGISHYAMHNLSCGGFNRIAFDAYAEAGAQALVNAVKDLEDVQLFLNAGEFNVEADVAFNRSLDAYNANPEVQQQDENNTHKAVDRLMKQIRIAGKKGNKGLINWFGVQGTSIGVENTKFHSDNKGYAASLLESDQADEANFVGGFACEASADVSPNYHGRAKWWPRGKYEDPFKSAYHNGFLQFERSKVLLENDDEQIPLNATIDYQHQFVNLSAIPCAPEFTPDHKPVHCGQAAAGLALLDGTPVDNPGLDAVSTTLVSSWVKYRNFLRNIPLIASKSSRIEFRKLIEAHGPKRILAELHEKKVLGFKNLNRVPLPPSLSDIGDELKRQYNAKALQEHTWFPAIVPLQIFILGDIAIVGYPGEITTVAGIRLKKSVLNRLHHRGIIDVIITSNANEYIGYTNTFEEYQVPTYERGMNFFGQYTLSAMQTAFNHLAADLLKPDQIRNKVSELEPPAFSSTELNARSAKWINAS
jgi:neutral ceramidase